MKLGLLRWLLLAGGLLSAGTAFADERILAYDSQIAIHRDGSMDVTETIRVRAEGDRIRRGIYRDFPTDYKDSLGNRYHVAFDFRDALRDDQPESWHAEAQANGVRIYLGRAEVLLEPGEYNYQIRYRTTRQLGFFAQHDELYWNVTGNGWEFPIDTVTATVELPSPVATTQLKASGYTGVSGSRDAFLTTETFEGGARYASRVGLSPAEGLSLVLEFPKSVVTQPDTRQKLLWLLQDNLNLLVGGLGLLALWVWYGLRWRAVGRDPKHGVRIPLYEPPANFSPASLRFVRRMGYDKTCFAAALLSLASKGLLKIEQDEDEVITLIKVKDADRKWLAPGEGKLLDALLEDDAPLRLAQSAATARLMSAADSALKSALAVEYEKKYFMTNSLTVVVGVAMAVLTQIASALVVANEFAWVPVFVCIPLSLLTIPLYGIWSAALKSLTGNGLWSKLKGLIGGALGLPILAIQIALLVAMFSATGLGAVVTVLLLATNVAFYHWMKAPTVEGARLLDQIDGFRWYLGVAEKQELDSRYRPESRPDLFAEYLPYALALDIEQAWAQRFADALPPEKFEEIQPAWYRSYGGFSSSSPTSLVSGLSDSLKHSISSASTAPGSSSGSSSGGGGGSSGGGGGGGGGGGW